MLMRADILTLFREAVELRSFYGAGNLHGLSAAEVSEQMRLLEEHHQMVLFERGRKQLTLTPEGERFHQSLLEQGEE